MRGRWGTRSASGGGCQGGSLAVGGSRARAADVGDRVERSSAAADLGSRAAVRRRFWGGSGGIWERDWGCGCSLGEQGGDGCTGKSGLGL